MDNKEYQSSESQNSFYEMPKITQLETFGSRPVSYGTNKNTFSSRIVARAISNGTRIPIKKLNLQQPEVPKNRRKLVFASDLEVKDTKPFPVCNNQYVKVKTSIKLKGLQLQSLPVELFELGNLESLILSPERESCLNYKLTYLPKEIGQLSNLQTLILDTNELDRLPDEIGTLKKLEILLLSNNLLTTLPQSLEHLANLKSLHVANNKFSEFPISICGLTSLAFLDMTDNEINSIPDEISNLTELHSLLLLMNSVEYIPESITQLTSITSLWLGENRLVSLPQSFGELFRLDWGSNPCSANIAGNPLVHPPLSICQQGPLEIRRYFHEKNKNESPN